MPETFSASDRIVVKPLMEQHQEKLDKLFKEKWDLIVADALFIPHGHAIALKLFEEQGVPYLLYETACQVEDWQMSIMAMSWSPVSKAYVYLDPSTTPNGHYNPQRFLERLLTFSSSFYETFHYYYMPVSTEYPNVEKLGVRNFKYSRVLNNAYGLFAERVDYMGWMMPISNQLIDVGANCRLKFETLPKQMKEFVEKPGSKGTIYIAFGSYANWSAALPNVIDSIHYTIKNLQEYQIIFSYNGDLNKMPSVKNLMLVKWAPQSAILTHPKTRLFVSHGGMKSVKEAVCSQVPLIALPLFAEQPYAANNVAKQKIGLVLHKHHVTGQQMLEQANKILNEPVYAENIRKFKRIYTDRVIPQMDLAQFHVERAIRSKHTHRFNKRQGAYICHGRSFYYLTFLVGLFWQFCSACKQTFQCMK
ncbi:UDP-glucuronosyl UDP-glucosyltransferase domain containing protein [Aphelenchoides bicaudatus]|nr:UDP-glucuronosyl UDP-glucosyltransferase domain containing protein [Aphelenchoides bicaudatus]